MKFQILIACTLSLLTSCASTNQNTSSTGSSSASEPSATTLSQFEHLKGLAGEWYQADESGRPTGDVMLSYRVSSNNSAVIETTFPGADFEMTTAYTLDGGDLVLTHYCALGNAPRMRAERGGDGNGVHFECTGVGNAKSHDDMHMHDAVFDFTDANRLNSTWTIWSEGALGNAETFELVRAAN